MWQLGLGLCTEQEQAFLHTWNVVSDLLVTGMLCGDTVMRDVGIDRQMPWPTRLLFWLGMALLRMVDAIAQWSGDPKAPQWTNALEDRLTTTGTWVKAPLPNVPG